jgi:outer membrane protein assembly factor BamA
VTSTVDRNFEGKPGQVAITINIAQGPQWLVDSVTLNGVAQVDPRTLNATLTSLAGQPFAEVNMARDRNEVLTYYFTQGFRNAAMKGEWRLSSAPNHVQIFYTVQEGDREYVRDVLISGLRITRRSLVDKAITLHAGSPLSPVEQTDPEALLRPWRIRPSGYSGRESRRRHNS